jgi:glycolate oxidase iron-sulfur subunit
VQRLFDPQVNAAAIAVLAANGVEVVIPPDQGCCGAVTHHQGELEQTRQLATAVIDSFAAVVGPGRPAGAEPLDAVLVAASGCGHTLKHYDAILAQEPAWAARGHAFAAQVQDVHQFLQGLGLSAEFRSRLAPLTHPDGTLASADQPLTVAYHDACHMLHGQGIAAEPRALLAAIPHLRLREAVEAGVCCGSAGIYNLVQPDEAAALGRIKAADLAGTGAELVASANIGCTLQIRRHLDEGDFPQAVLHPLQLLERSWRAGQGRA